MTDRPSAREPRDAPPPRPLPSARDSVRPERDTSRGRRRGGGRRRRGGSSGGESATREARPTGPPPDLPPPDVDEVEVPVGDESFVVRVLGRSETGGARGGVPLLLLGFRSGHDEEEGGEVMVVGRTLAGLSQSDLRAAIERALPPRAG